MVVEHFERALHQFARVGGRGTQHQARFLQDLIELLFIGLGPVAPERRGGGIENVQNVFRRQPAIARAERLEFLLQRPERIGAPKFLFADFRETVEIGFQIKSGHDSLRVATARKRGWREALGPSTPTGSRFIK